MSPLTLVAAPATPTVSSLLLRIAAEYRDMPGLHLTSAQAARLLGIERPLCDALLDHLADEGVLSRCHRGHYVRSDRL